MAGDARGHFAAGRAAQAAYAMAHVMILQRIFAGGCPRDVTKCSASSRFRRRRSQVAQDSADVWRVLLAADVSRRSNAGAPVNGAEQRRSPASRGARSSPRPAGLQTGACAPPSDYDGAAALRRRSAATALERSLRRMVWGGGRARHVAHRDRGPRGIGGQRVFAAPNVDQLARLFRGSAGHRGRARPRASGNSGRVRRWGGGAPHRRATAHVHRAGVGETRRRRLRGAGGLSRHLQALAAARSAFPALDPQCRAQPLL